MFAVQLYRYGRAGGIANHTGDVDGFLDGVGSDAGGIDPDRVSGAEGNFTHDAVPVGLRVIGHAVSVPSDIDLVRIVHAQGDAMRAGLKSRAQIVLVRRGETVAHADGHSIHPHFGLPVRPLQKQDNVQAAPAFRNDYLSLVPGGAFVFVGAGEPAGIMAPAL